MITSLIKTNLKISFLNDLPFFFCLYTYIENTNIRGIYSTSAFDGSVSIIKYLEMHLQFSQNLKVKGIRFWVRPGYTCIKSIYIEYTSTKMLVSGIFVFVMIELGVFYYQMLKNILAIFL